MSIALLASQAAERAYADKQYIEKDQPVLSDEPNGAAPGEEYRFLAAQCQTSDGNATALILLHRLFFESEVQTLAAVVRGAIHMVPGCNPIGNDGFIGLEEARKVADVALPKPTLVFALLPGPIVDFGPALTRYDGGKESYQWAVGYSVLTGDHSAFNRTKVLSPLSAVLVGSWRCFNSRALPISARIVSRNVQSCDLDQSAVGLFVHDTVDALVLSIDDGSRFFGGAASARRAVAEEMKRQLSFWLTEYQPE